MALIATPLSQELDNRFHDGIDVSLLWNRVTGELAVSVFDLKTDIFFELPAKRSNALDVFNHPYAYAASFGIELPDRSAFAA